MGSHWLIGSPRNPMGRSQHSRIKGEGDPPQSPDNLDDLQDSAYKSLSSGDILAPTLYHGYYIRPRINKQLDRGISEVTLNDHKFQVFLDVCHFTPDEIAVRTVDNLLEVTAQHPQKADRHGFISREFTRTYILPLDADPLLVKATVTHDGILCLEAPRTGKEVKANIHEVPVTYQEEQAAGKGESLEEKA